MHKPFPIRAVLLEVWWKHRTFIPFLLVGLAGLIYWNWSNYRRFPLQEYPDAEDAWVLGANLAFHACVFALLFFCFSGEEEGPEARSLVDRRLLFPVPTATLVVWPLLLACIVIFLNFALLKFALSYGVHGIRLHAVVGSLVVCSLFTWGIAGHWALRSYPRLRFIAFGMVMVLFFLLPHKVTDPRLVSFVQKDATDSPICLGLLLSVPLLAYGFRKWKWLCFTLPWIPYLAAHHYADEAMLTIICFAITFFGFIACLFVKETQRTGRLPSLRRKATSAVSYLPPRVSSGLAPFWMQVWVEWESTIKRILWIAVGSMVLSKLLVPVGSRFMLVSAMVFVPAILIWLPREPLTKHNRITGYSAILPVSAITRLGAKLFWMVILAALLACLISFETVKVLEIRVVGFSFVVCFSFLLICLALCSLGLWRNTIGNAVVPFYLVFMYVYMLDKIRDPSPILAVWIGITMLSAVMLPFAVRRNRVRGGR